MKTPSPFWSGTAAEVGAAQQRAWRAAWEPFHARLHAEGNRRIDAARVRQLVALLETWAPDWLIEAEAFAGEHLEGYLDDQCRRLQPDPHTLAEANCSTLLALGRATADGAPLLLKIRDEAPHPQIRFRRKVGATRAVLTGTNLGNLGIAQMANDAGLVGANNTGGPLKECSGEVGLNDCLVLRLIAETCATCAEAVRLLERLAAARALGNGGYARGMIFLLADATGRGVIAECSRTEVAVREVTDGVCGRTNHFLLPEMGALGDPARNREIAVQSSLERYDRLMKLARELPTLSPERLMEISRDTAGTYPLCQSASTLPWRTVSSWVHRVRPVPQPPQSWCCDTAPVDGRYVPDSSCQTP
ncbi:MAG TPA: C45 family autoproteolytic acyltransferase/hydrolase [Chthoniobacteraceae bacterium]|nr:C45 family autoproteolytic acyltransferase/hydrolase [Chthoniobacteraceae bacterium]